MRILAVFIACLSIAAISISGVAAVGTVDSFRLVKHYSSPTGGAEIVAASPDGMTLAYSDATSGSVGFLDITDPEDMSFLGAVETAGEPSSAAFSPDGEWVFAAVRTYVREEGAPANLTPGLLYVIDADTRLVAGTVEIGVQPDSVKAFADGSDIKVVIAIENEPLVVEDGVQTDDDEPGIAGDISGPGLIQVVTINTANVPASVVEDILLPESDMTAAGLEFADDPQPEFVDIHGMTAAVSLQENNGFVVIDLTDNSISGIYSSGVVGDRPADLDDDSMIDFSDTYPADVAGEDYAGLRFPDSLAFNATGTVIYAADEGEFDYTGGRGVSAWSTTGELLGDDGGEIEAMAVRTGMYPDGRSDAKGVEMEGLTVATFDGTPFALYLSERGSFLTVYNISNPTDPTLVQVLGTGIAPEGIVAIPSRNLVVTAEEEFGSFTIFEGVEGPWSPDADRPVLISASVDVPWCALSGLDDAGDGKLVGVGDSAFAPTRIFEIQTGSGFAALTTPVTLMREGEEATYDGEGIAVDTSDIAPANPGWWIGSEGNAAFGEDDYLPNLLVQVDGDGEVLREVWLPEAIDSPDGGTIRSNGFEGVALSGDGRYALAPIQRQFAGESAAFTRIARVDLTTLDCDGITCTGD